MKISLRNLLLWVAFAGAVIAALAQPSLLWMRLAFTLAVLFMAYSLVGAIAGRGKPRTFWIGSTAFAFAYFVLLLDGQMIDFHQQASMLPRALVTQQLLDWLADARGLHVRSGYGDFKLFDDSMYQSNGGGANGPSPSGVFNGGGFFDVQPDDPSQQSDSPMEPGTSDDASAVEPSSAAGGAGPAAMPGGTPSAGIPPMPVSPGMDIGMGTGMTMPGIAAPAGGFTHASYNHFLITGHCIFLILVGLVGGAVSKRMFSEVAGTPSS